MIWSTIASILKLQAFNSFNLMACAWILHAFKEVQATRWNAYVAINVNEWVTRAVPHFSCRDWPHFLFQMVQLNSLQSYEKTRHQETAHKANLQHFPRSSQDLQLSDRAKKMQETRARAFKFACRARTIEFDYDTARLNWQGSTWRFGRTLFLMLRPEN